MVREKKGGKFTRVTEAMDKQKLGRGEEIVEVYEKDPSIHAFADLMNRALDRNLTTGPWLGLRSQSSRVRCAS